MHVKNNVRQRNIVTAEMSVDTYSRIFLTIVCTIGLCFQITNLSSQYFKFTTTTTAVLQDDVKILPTNVVLCFSAFDVLDDEWLVKNTGYNWTDPETNMSMDDSLDILQNFTIYELLSQVERKENLLDEFLYRSETGEMMYSDNASEIFNITRYFTIEYVCYRITPLKKYTFDPVQISLASNYIFSIYELQLKGKFLQATILNPTVYNTMKSDAYPYESRQFSCNVLNSIDPETKVITNNMIAVSYSVSSVESLPPPYDTRCVNLSAQEKNSCYKQCMLRKLKPYHKVPANLICPEPGPQDFIINMRNPEMRNTSETFRKQCETLCDMNPCHRSYSATTATTYKAFDPEVVYIDVRMPQYSSRLTRATPTMSFIDFFSLIGGCFGTWYGVSFMSFIRLMETVKKRRSREVERKQDPKPIVHHVHHIVHRQF